MDEGSKWNSVNSELKETVIERTDAGAHSRTGYARSPAQFGGCLFDALFVAKHLRREGGNSRYSSPLLT
jgi:hypothetical protein